MKKKTLSKFPCPFNKTFHKMNKYKNAKNIYNLYRQTIQIYKYKELYVLKPALPIQPGLEKKSLMHY